MPQGPRDEGDPRGHRAHEHVSRRRGESRFSADASMYRICACPSIIRGAIAMSLGDVARDSPCPRSSRLNLSRLMGNCPTRPRMPSADMLPLTQRQPDLIASTFPSLRARARARPICTRAGRVNTPATRSSMPRPVKSRSCVARHAARWIAPRRARKRAKEQLVCRASCRTRSRDRPDAIVIHTASRVPSRASAGTSPPRPRRRIGIFASSQGVP